MVVSGEGVGGLGGKGEGIVRYREVVTNGHRDLKYSIGNMRGSPPKPPEYLTVGPS